MPVLTAIELDKTYLLRNGQRVYAAKWWHGDRRPDDIMIGYGDDGICHRFKRDGAHWDYFFGGPVFNDPRMDIVGEAIDLDDLRAEYLASENHRERQSAFDASLDGDPDQDVKSRARNRANRPPGPLGRGMKESDYD